MSLMPSYQVHSESFIELFEDPLAEAFYVQQLEASLEDDSTARKIWRMRKAICKAVPKKTAIPKICKRKKPSLADDDEDTIDARKINPCNYKLSEKNSKL